MIKLDDKPRLFEKLSLLLVLIGLPLIGILADGRSVSKYTEFPPVTQYVEHAEFSWPVFIALAAAIMAVAAPFLARAFCSSKDLSAGRRGERRPFPWWGWAGLAFTLIAWILAWTRFEWFAPFQKFTFSPIWLGYIVVVNALTQKFSGRSMLRDSPVRLLMLFLASAIFWWYFEYLNRFVQNWFYEGVGDLSPLQYFIFATLPFSTVLPAVLSTNELLHSFPQLGSGLDDFIRIDLSRHPLLPWAMMAISCAGLAAIGVWPNYLFPLLWLSPLLVITSWQAIKRKRTIFSPVASGQWRNICLLALAALVCGFFWEMWNFHSLAQWKYSIPFVGRFRIFEMPILGYAGYLPFGLECAVVAEWVIRR